MPKTSTARKTADDAVTVEYWTGAPVQCAQWMVQLALDSQKDLDAGSRTLIKLGVDTGRQGLPQYYNKVHYLCRSACIDAGRDLMYSFENPPPGRTFWTTQQKRCFDLLTAHLATESDAGKHAGMAVTVTLPMSCTRWQQVPWRATGG